MVRDLAGRRQHPVLPTPLLRTRSQEGIAPNYSVTGESLAERGVPADAERDHAWYAKSASEEGPRLAFSGGRAAG